MCVCVCCILYVPVELAHLLMHHSQSGHVDGTQIMLCVVQNATKTLVTVCVVCVCVCVYMCACVCVLSIVCPGPAGTPPLRCCSSHPRVGSSCLGLSRTAYVYTLYMTVYLGISLPNIPCIHHRYMVLANPTHASCHSQGCCALCR